MKHARPDYNRIQDPECLIPKDEPVFLVRGQDKIGYLLVHMWAIINEHMGGDPKLSELAMQHSVEMKAWPKKKTADL